MNEAIAYHEAGHAIACLALGFKFKYVTVIENKESNSLGHVLLEKLKFHSDFDISDKTRLKVEKYIAICLAGPIAERKFTGGSNDIAASKDYEMSFLLAANIFGPTHLINAFMDFLCIYTETLFSYLLEEGQSDTGTWEEVKVLAKELLIRQKLSNKEVCAIFPQYF